MATVYLLHFLEPIGNPTNPQGQAQHYIGVDQTGKRIEIQTADAGANAAIVRAVQAQGIGFVVAATWTGGRVVERQLKNRKCAPRFCPVYRGGGEAIEAPWSACGRVCADLDCGIWRASCTGCGYELAEGRRQDRVERKAARRSCPVCVEVG